MPHVRLRPIVSAFRFSWRAIGAWLASSLIASAAFGFVVSLMNQWADPSERNLGDFFSVAGVISAMSAVEFVAVGGLILMAVALIARRTKAPRPALDIASLAVVFFCVANVGDLVVISLETPAGRLGAFDHVASFIVQFIAPALSGALMGGLYWRFAERARPPCA